MARGATSVVSRRPFVVLLAYARDLNVMLLGEEDAQSLGIEVERTERVLLALSAVITAAGVAVAGIVGFVGLIVPHVMRLLVGPDHRILLPTAALAGASFLVATDTLARSGAPRCRSASSPPSSARPFFLYLLRNGRCTTVSEQTAPKVEPRTGPLRADA